MVARRSKIGGSPIPVPPGSQSVAGLADSEPTPDAVLKLHIRKKCSERNASRSPSHTSRICLESGFDFPGAPLSAVGAANESPRAGQPPPPPPPPTSPLVYAIEYRPNR